MSSITKHRVGPYIYLDESTSFWDAESKSPDNRKKSIGRMDPDTGVQYFKQEYVDRLNQEGKQTDGMKIWFDQRKEKSRASMSGINGIELAQEILATVKNYGLSYFLQSIAEKTGLVGILSQAIPGCWQKILVLACFLVAEDKPVAYCSDWIEANECPDVGSMASQRISELLGSFGYNERTRFFNRWYLHVREQELVALDITSLSSYSENIGMLGWGYNRDGDDLRQLNICMLLGEKTIRPIYQTVYQGSLSDVTTLETTLNEFEAITGSRDITLVMDKAFSSTKNVNKMLGDADHPPYRFLTSASFTTNFANALINNERAGIDNVNNVIFTHDAEMPIRGIYKLCKWDRIKTPLHTHIYYNPEEALLQRNDVFSRVAKLKTLALENHKNPDYQKAFQDYLIINDSKGSGVPVSVRIREDVIDRELERAGWFIFISNYVSDSQVAFDLYRAKDVVEKSFFQYKNNLGLYRLRVHNDERAQNKIFVAFVALILSSHIHKVMKDTGLSDTYPFGKLLSALSKLKIAYVNRILVFQPPTKEQKTIFQCFGVDLPVTSDL